MTVYHQHDHSKLSFLENHIQGTLNISFNSKLFWEKKLSGLHPSDIAEELVKTMDLPKGLQSKDSKHFYISLEKKSWWCLPCFLKSHPNQLTCVVQVLVQVTQIRHWSQLLRALFTPALLPSRVSCLRRWRRILESGSTHHNLCANLSWSPMMTSGTLDHFTQLTFHLLVKENVSEQCHVL